ncbi:MAG: hypothetical protein K6G81_05385 [Lachnospiraceae bacterium]|nr:hypothetical protein [Lachnospiraceae bacterium]
MPDYTAEEFKNLIKNERKEHFITPFDLVYKTFCDCGYDKKAKDFFMENASEYIMDMRSKCWEEFVPFERDFTTRMLSYLININRVNKMTPVDAIKDFTMQYPQHIYDLSLSNTQSRRSRAGKEFEAILELMLIGAGIPAAAQGSIGKQQFQTQQIGKLVDLVVPGVIEYLQNKRNTMLISAKTTLRERWQEVPEEVTRTGIREMYLATLDDSFSQETLQILYEANVIIVTTGMIKEAKYRNSSMVITFEDMLQLARESVDKWGKDKYSAEDTEKQKAYLNKQIERFADYPYVKSFYEKKLADIL